MLIISKNKRKKGIYTFDSEKESLWSSDWKDELLLKDVLNVIGLSWSLECALHGGLVCQHYKGMIVIWVDNYGYESLMTWPETLKRRRLGI